MAIDSSGEPQRILRAWTMLELFSPPKLPKVTNRATRPEDRQVIMWRAGEPLPWLALPTPEQRPKCQRFWQHTVYLGVYRLEDTYQYLHRKFPADRDAYDARRSGTSACAALLVDETGCVMIESCTLSSALWAVGRIRSEGDSPTWALGFADAQKEFTRAVDRYEGVRRDASNADVQLPQTAASLDEVRRVALDAVGLSRLVGGETEIETLSKLATGRVLIDSRIITLYPGDEPPDIDFLNSLYLDELERVVSDTTGGITARALATYLTPSSSIDYPARVDVIESPTAVERGVTLDRLPLGRWPSNPKHNLALSQQFAVNMALNELSSQGGLMGVNGPPGTGKTTMLRDIVAGNVVERARRLAALRTPQDAFLNARAHTWTDSGGYPRAVPQLRPDLVGFEMIVASANNAAVENVSTEIPSTQAIDASWRETASYFGDIASAVLKETSDKDAFREGDRRLAWGLVAARLGNKSNRSRFRRALWFDTKDRPEGGRKPVDREFADVPRLQTRLKQWEAGACDLLPWPQACRAFHQAEQRVHKVLQRRRVADRRLSDLHEAYDREAYLVQQVDHLAGRLTVIEQDLVRHIAAEQVASERHTLADALHRQHLASKPGVLEIAFSLGRATREWRAALDPLATELASATSAKLAATSAAARAREQRLTAQRAAAEAHRALAQTKADLARLVDEVAADEQFIGAGYPGSNWSGEQREFHAPWLDAELDRARSDLFLAALQLHQELVANLAKDMTGWLRAAIEVVAGDVPSGLEESKRRAAWQLFFLVVPVASTTFASLGRMFTGLGAETLGWLLIDEAGQAPPQYAVGGIWRAQRVVAVGDPLQLQPVVTIPQQAQRAIAKRYNVGPEWIPPRASVQGLADRVSPFGTLLDQGETRMWVAAPLRVHRRCDDPMFTLSNVLAYNSIMVNGVPPRGSFTPEGLIAESHWADEPATTQGSHLQQNQIRRLERGLAYLAEHGVATADVIAISPFREVADMLRSLVRHYPGLTGGTIHTAQGREAPVVFLVLGGAPDNPGAKEWAASTVNLVNVAVSRAQRRLYVIGDRQAWQGHNFFRQLAHALPQQPPAAQTQIERPMGRSGHNRG